MKHRTEPDLNPTFLFAGDNGDDADGGARPAGGAAAAADDADEPGHDGRHVRPAAAAQEPHARPHGHRIDHGRRTGPRTGT